MYTLTLTWRTRLGLRLVHIPFPTVEAAQAFADPIDDQCEITIAPTPIRHQEPHVNNDP